MPEHEFTIRVAGGAGDGIDTTGFATAKALMRSGLDVATHRHYASRIRGSHTYFELRASDEPLRSWGDEYEVLVALGDSFARSPNPDAYYTDPKRGPEELHPLTENLHDLKDGGVIVYDAGLLEEEEILEYVPDWHDRIKENDWQVLDLDLTAWAEEYGRKVMRNIAGVTAAWALLDQDPHVFKDVMAERLPEKALEANLKLFDDVYETLREEHGTAANVNIPEGEHEEEQVLISGSEAAAYAALQEGIRFVSGYPMTPSTALFENLTEWFTEVEPKGVSQQVEDEIAGINAAIGASHVGAKALTTTSGGGFSLQSEAIGLAEVTETPIVVCEASRGGPSTGLPTKPEQSDLEHVLYTSQGDTGRVVLAPGSMEDMHHVVRDAVRLAYGDPDTGWEGFQGPVLVMYDAELARFYTNLPRSFFEGEGNGYVGAVPDREEIEAGDTDDRETFARYRHDAPDGVNVRPLPGQLGARYLATGSEHNEYGHVSEDPVNRKKIMDRRLGKLEAVRRQLQMGETHQEVHGPRDALHGIIAWGFPAAVAAGSVDRLNEAGRSVKLVKVVDMQPFPREEVRGFIESVDKVLVPEMNATGQLRALIQRELGDYHDKLVSLLKYDGVPFREIHIMDGFEAMLEGREPETDYNTKIDPHGGI
jgi:pyruvate ferredoxin oxidoreductase alpha subunit